MTRLRDHTFLGTTQSLCPECLALVPAKIISKGSRVYFRKRCPTHGVREDFVCSDVALYDQMQYSLPGKVPPGFGVEPDKGCPYDCGLCTEHEQHTCIGLAEITSSCNLKCPMCYASSGPGGAHLSFEDCVRSIDRLVEVEGRAEVLQLSGGEPTIHPEFLRILDYAVGQPIDIVMVNTNGIRLAHDEKMLDAIAGHAPRVEVYLQFDGFEERGSKALRGESLVETKLKAVENLGKRGIKTSLVCTLQPGINDHEIGAIVRYGVERPWVTGISFQPATYSGRHVLPEELERRITFPDVIRAIAEQTGGMFAEDDFMPLPCAHPNCHSLTYAFRSEGKVTPLMRFIDARKHLDILANGILFSRNAARKLIEKYLERVGGCGIGCFPEDSTDAAASEFFAKAVAEQLSQADVFRITITSFLDAYNFDVRRLMKCCIHHVLPSGHVIPFCAYNVLYREGHAVLPALREAGALTEQPMTIGLPS
ncbi:radical SAM protein [Tundrisphaera lichenicola]|uniref:radical SAM protein n=1 Tax=Tundrisphaera lichenicola TaxID=2029860 RepID=UPI003EBEEB81